MLFEEFLEENFPDEWKTDWPDSDILSEGMDYALTSGGKRVRPLLCLKICEGLGGDVEKAKVFGRAIEMYHNFTLVHDDLQDRDEYRRDQKSVWAKYGLEQSITVGDGMHSAAYSYIVDNSERFEPEKTVELLEILNNADREVIDGQAEDISFRQWSYITEDDYIEMTEKKTGALLRASLKAGAVIAGADETTVERLEKFGEKIGPAFQIRDDVIDLIGEKGRKEKGQDIGEGKRSLIVVKALQELEEEKSERLLEILDRDKEETTQEEVTEAIDLFRSVDAIEEANSVAENMAEEAKEQLEKINEENGNSLKEVEEITEFLVERKF